MKFSKSIADICKRYGYSFDDKCDEIDMRTGHIIVDRGHLRGMSDADNTTDLWAGGSISIYKDNAKNCSVDGMGQTDDDFVSQSQSESQSESESESGSIRDNGTHRHKIDNCTHLAITDEMTTELDSNNSTDTQTISVGSISQTELGVKDGLSVSNHCFSGMLKNGGHQLGEHGKVLDLQKEVAYGNDNAWQPETGKLPVGERSGEKPAPLREASWLLMQMDNIFSASSPLRDLDVQGPRLRSRLAKNATAIPWRIDDDHEYSPKQCERKPYP
ncbi:hypothetical protein FHETE_11459 [Fusarium heterosporum]|uniref:Uncharacterized protein n=1 Tax=Fusarium heterosporum TaxID=42747 RepID=A0A8H5WB85_FUSHE|nr:hypothetical protein FHETE_11459 [Fusarium heterosporum]